MERQNDALLKVGRRLSDRETLLALIDEDAEQSSAATLERSYGTPPNGFPRAFLLLCVVVLVFAGTNYALRMRAGSLPGRRVQGVAFSGTCHPASEVRVSSETLSTVAEVLVHPGDVVEKGQLLLRMEDGEALAALRSAALQRSIALRKLSSLHSHYEAVKASLAASQNEQQLLPSRQVRDSPARARVAYEQALSAFNRASALVELGVLAKQEMEARAAEMHLAKDDLDNAEKLSTAAVHVAADRMEQASVESQLQREEVEQRYSEADLTFEECKRKLALAQIRAPARAVVAEVVAQVGDRLPAGVLLARLAELHTMTVEVPVAADMISQLHLNQPASIQLPTLPVREVQGTVRVINPLPSANMTHSVLVEFRNGELDLLSGQPAKVRFLEP